MELDPPGIGAISSSVMRQFGEARCNLYATIESSAAWRRVEQNLDLAGRDTVSEVHAAHKSLLST